MDSTNKVPVRRGTTLGLGIHYYLLSFLLLVFSPALNSLLTCMLSSALSCIFGTLHRCLGLSWAALSCPALCPMNFCFLISPGVCALPPQSRFYLGSPFLIPWPRNSFQNVNCETHRIHVIYFPSLRSHSPSLSVVQGLEIYGFIYF